MDQQHETRGLAAVGRGVLLAMTVVGAMTMFAGAAVATSDASDLPPAWHGWSRRLVVPHDRQRAGLGDLLPGNSHLTLDRLHRQPAA
jgi:heme A synthase